MTKFDGYDDDCGSESGPQTFYTEFKHKVYEHYLDYGLESFAKARELCTILRAADSGDTVILRINSPGGRLDIAAMIINAIHESSATVIGVIEYTCASAATMIFLSCSQWHVQNWGSMMIHMASYGVYGKSHEVSSRVEDTRARAENIVREVYQDFLTEDEIDDVIKGQDIYLTSDEIVSRLEVLADIRNQEVDTNEDTEEQHEASD